MLPTIPRAPGGRRTVSHSTSPFYWPRHLHALLGVREGFFLNSYFFVHFRLKQPPMSMSNLLTINVRREPEVKQPPPRNLRQMEEEKLPMKVP